MRPHRFRYVRAESASDATRAWQDAAAAGEHVCFLAGGQQLLPELNTDRQRPGVVIDLKPAWDLTVTLDASRGSGGEVVGAATRHVDLAARSGHGARWTKAARRLGPLPVRTRATVGGHVAGASPGRLWPTVLLALDGRMEVLSDGRRELHETVAGLEALQQSAALLCGTVVPRSSDPVGVGIADVGGDPDPGITTCVVTTRVTAGRVAAATAAGCVGTELPARLLALEAALVGLDLSGDLPTVVTSALPDDTDRGVALQVAAIDALDDLRRAAPVPARQAS